MTQEIDNMRGVTQRVLIVDELDNMRGCTQRVYVVNAGDFSDPHNKGYFATQASLEEAYPTAEAGDWAIVGETDTVWVWDVEGAAWVDTDTKGEVTPDMIIVKSLTMPSASTTPAGAVYQYIGQTNANYTHGYVYENVKTATYTGTVSFEAATLSGTTVACSGDNFANFLTESGVEPLTVVSGTMTYDAAGSLWVLVGKNADNETVLTFQEYQQDYEDFGFTFTGTPQDGDVVAFTCSIEEASASYAWNRIDVQPAPEGLPDQTGNSGKFLTTDGTDASWSDKPLVNQATGADSFSPTTLLGSSKVDTTCVGINSGAGGNAIRVYDGSAYGYQSIVKGAFNTAIGAWCGAGNGDGGALTQYNGNVAIGYRVSAGANISGTHDAIIIGSSRSNVSNEESDTFKIVRSDGVLTVIDANGKIPKGLLSNAATSPATMPTLAVADWSSNTQTVTVTGVTAMNTVFVSPAPASAADYAAAGIICTAQATDSLTFTCTTTPTNAITVNIVIIG